MRTHIKRLLLCLALLPHAAAVSAAAPVPQRPGRVDLIVSGGTVVTMDAGRRVIEDGAVAVAGGRVV
ncbi:MAG TPA: hypothetical protein VF654_15780, partial [Pyrinomonadaceae bacterium]